MGEITSIKGPKIRKGESHVWDKQPLGIPATIPTIKDAVISVEYHVNIVLGAKFGGNLGLLLPVTIGTIPHMHEKVIERYGTPEHPQSAPESKVVTGPPADISALGFDNIPVPLYSRPIIDKFNTGSGDDNAAFEEEEDVVRYAPVYAFVKQVETKEEGGPDNTEKDSS